MLVIAVVAMPNFCLKLHPFYEPDEEIDNEPEVNIPSENEVCDEGQVILNAIVIILSSRVQFRKNVKQKIQTFVL